MKRSRRAFLEAAAAVGALGAAGCNGPPETTPGDTNPGNGGTATDTQTGPGDGNGTATETATPTDIPVGSVERWETFQYDHANTGTVPLYHRGFSVGQSAELASFSGNHVAQPAFDEDRIYVPTDTSLVALDRETGSEEWRFESVNAAVGTPALSDDGYAYTVTAKGVYKVDAESGDDVWQFVFSNEIDTYLSAAAVSGAILRDDMVVFNMVMNRTEGTPSTTGRVMGLDLFDGSVRWDFQTSRRARSPPKRLAPTPALADGTLYFTVGQDDRAATLYALNANNGNVRWRNGYVGKGWYSVSANENLLAFADEYIQLYKRDGTKIVRRTVDPPPKGHGTAIGSEYVFMTSRVYGGNEGRLYAIDESGRVKWSFEGEGNFYTPVVTDELVYVASGTGVLFALDQSDGLVHWRSDFDVSGILEASGPAVGTDEIYLTAATGSGPTRVLSLDLQ